MPTDYKADELPGTAKWREAHPSGDWLKTAVRNPLYSPSSPEYQANLARISQPQMVQNPLTQPLTAPVTTPQIPTLQPQPEGPVAPQPKITLPAAFQQNYQAGPTTNPNQGIKMPNIQRPLQGFDGGSNWTDFLTVAHNRYQR